jgi:hypothetical protein
MASIDTGARMPRWSLLKALLKDMTGGLYGEIVFRKL